MESASSAKLLKRDTCINETDSKEAVSLPVVPRPLEEKVYSVPYCSCIFCKFNERLLNRFSIKHGNERFMSIN